MADLADSTAPRPWLSVITVVKDDAEGFSLTQASLKQQDLHGVEFIVIDGSTSPSSIADLVSELAGSTYIFEAPAGIYAAMNSGLRVARGDYVYFANAGDWFADTDVVAKIRQKIQDAAPVWLFGPVTIRAEDGTSVTTPHLDYAREQKRFFAHGLFPPHQGTVARRNVLLEQGGFDTSFSISADYAMALRLSLVADPLQLTFPLAVFTQGGVSSAHWQESFRQFHRARQTILQLRGLDSLREHWETRNHFAKVWLYRKTRG